METIIILLIVLVPVVFKLIGKSLEKAAQSPDAPQKRVVQQTVEPVSERPVYEPVVSRKQQLTENVPQEGESLVVRPQEPVQDVLENNPKMKNKIDPKKLIVYSEIMKPKY